ncbi:hypothetical protein D3C87_2074370 [compost metagenome]
MDFAVSVLSFSFRVIVAVGAVGTVCGAVVSATAARERRLVKSTDVQNFIL